LSTEQLELVVQHCIVFTVFSLFTEEKNSFVLCRELRGLEEGQRGIGKRKSWIKRSGG